MTGPWAIRVPASSANLGSGFDVVGMALSLWALVGVNVGQPLSDRAQIANEHHPATVAYRALGGSGELWTVSPIPAARGLGFSGAMRVGGAAAAVIERDGFDGLGGDGAAQEILECAASLEQHADNAAASLFGGVVATSGTDVARVEVGFSTDIVVWVPDEATNSTDRSRAQLSSTVDRTDAVFNLGKLALLITALANGDLGRLRSATEDRLHQPQRLDALPGSSRAIEVALSAGADAAWLSGSGPSVATICAQGQRPAVAQAWSEMAATDGFSGHVKELGIDFDGACVVGDGESPDR